ncbi:hypothetical protein CBS147343_5077 [Aspergillus niger]|uniref:lactonase family protein n=1 Tax=Aspergillus lacticoffeatus (strain CBS 101883) TaxID=1450533 RepID=UPI000D8003F4|nr:putative isomerase YbhE [Aspergillus niger CBS 101883]KAI2842460.1 hypothetical protein CBS11350_5726 [Aspergillus niger]KAI2910211.1 hypothetical protein CBS147371_9115 [Aspergillus niger]KAI2941462.1 hypothetical protein CBS147321_5901 [Aspergillus niger]KAI3072742.1 hypothetical protein CBS147343_5077 [Aspergillus niger]PYH54578.1 putative isomerase YbhE [Aspergillus niger CBS 101883]
MDTVSSTTATYVYIGSFVMPQPGKHEGLHVFRVDNGTGALTLVASYVPGLNVGSFAIDYKRGMLYVTDEVPNGGQIYAFSMDPSTGGLTERGHWPSYGTQPSGIALVDTEDMVIVSHFTSRTGITTIAGDAQSGYHIERRYDDATTVLFTLDATGCSDQPSHVHFHTTSGHQSKPSCLHSVSLSPDGSFLIECDMEKDQLVTMTIDYGLHSLHLQGIRDVPHGSGPRYSAFHPTLPVFYVNFEYRPVIEAFLYRVGGDYESLGTVDVLPENLNGGSGVLLSDLRVHPTGKYVYTLVRGHNVVSAFAVDEVSGRLRRIQTANINGISPKGCTFSPDGRFFYVAVSVSNEVQVWAVDANGILVPTQETAAVPRPSAITMVELTPP